MARFKPSRWLAQKIIVNKGDSFTQFLKFHEGILVLSHDL